MYFFLIDKGKVEILAAMRKKAVQYPRKCWHRMSLRIDSLRRGDSRSADKHILLGNESVLSLHIEFVKQIDISKMKAFRVDIITFGNDILELQSKFCLYRQQFTLCLI